MFVIRTCFRDGSLISHLDCFKALNCLAKHKIKCGELRNLIFIAKCPLFRLSSPQRSHCMFLKLVTICNFYIVQSPIRLLQSKTNNHALEMFMDNAELYELYRRDFMKREVKL